MNCIDCGKTAQLHTSTSGKLVFYFCLDCAIKRKFDSSFLSCGLHDDDIWLRLEKAK